MTILAIGFALLSAVCLAVGAHLQHGAVASQHSRLDLRHLAELMRAPIWLRGIGLFLAGTGLNIVALTIAPVMVVQPVGAVSLIIAVLIGRSARRLSFNRHVIFAVLACTGGVGLFIVLAALHAASPPANGLEARYVAGLTMSLVIVFGFVALIARRAGHLLRIVAAGMLFGCVAASVHLVGQQYLTGGLGQVSWLTFAGIATASLLGSWFVQSAYASGPPELVIAGLTVIDPIVAVTIGAAVLNEATATSGLTLAIMILCAAVAVAGVFVLSKYHPGVAAPTQPPPGSPASSPLSMTNS